MTCTIRTDYPFLAHPPQKKRPQMPLPPLPPLESRRRSGTFSTIASWAARVQPGSPASLSPCSPHRRPSLCKTRRTSVTSICVPSASFLHVTPTPITAFVPTPSIRDFKADLTTVGYTSVFLQLPNTPISAALSLSVKPRSPGAAGNIPVSPMLSPTREPRGFTRFRSLSVLRARGRSKSACPDSPAKMKARAAATSAAVVKRKKAKYALRPPPLANELALMQFTDGGDMGRNVKRVMEARAKASGAVGLADVHRDGRGGIWWDQDEEWEYAHLLAEGDASRPHDLQWVTFGGNTSPSTAGVPGEDRRGSVSTQDSDLDPKYIVGPADLLDGDDLAPFGSTAVPLATRIPPTSVLSLPSRPRRTAQHLRKPDFLVDVAFSWPHTSPMSPKLSTTLAVGVGVKARGKARRRPAPLKLSPPSPAFKQPTNSPIDADKVRKDFIDASFAPAGLVPVTPATATATIGSMKVRTRLTGNDRVINVPRKTVNDGSMIFGMKTKPSMLNMMALFRREGRT